MDRADGVFGSNDVEFTRVVDEAGALTHHERMELIRSLADLERHVSPVALCVYITDHGQLQEFRPHAHWVLNHARIHHPSFGRREQIRAIEDAEFRERRPGEGRPAEEEEEISWPTRQWQSFCSWCRDLWLPTPPPTRQDWMLILVLDVQLEIACFSWGYMLDPYITPDKITSCIVGARLQFRERALVTALKKVMKSAAAHLAQASRRVNKSLRQSSRRRLNVLPWLLGVGLGGGWAMVPSARAQEAAPPPPAEVVQPAPEVAPAEPVPEPAPPVVPGVAASYEVEPKWSSVDYTNLMSGNLSQCYNLLMPGEVQKKAPEKSPRRASAPSRRGTAQDSPEAESDTRVPGRYCKFYLDPRGTALRDPQQLLTEVERADVAHLLRELNAHARFHIYVSVFKDGQEVPREIAAANLVTNVAQPGQYVAVLQYALGEPPVIEIGYKEIRPTDEQVREWQFKVRESVVAAGGGGAGLLTAVRCLHDILLPLSESFTPLTPETAGNVRLIELPLKPEKREKEVTFKDKMKEWVESGAAIPYVVFGVTGVVIAGLFTWLFLWSRSCGRLFESEPDYRLGSRYGAGVSRYVRYLEGKEASREKKLL